MAVEKKRKKPMEKLKKKNGFFSKPSKHYSNLFLKYEFDLVNFLTIFTFKMITIASFICPKYLTSKPGGNLNTVFKMNCEIKIHRVIVYCMYS